MRRVNRLAFPWIICVSLVAGCATSGGDDTLDEDQDVGTQYVHIGDFGGIDWEAWYGLAGRLNDEFDAICGDTFCEGEYANIRPLSIDCSVSSIRGSVRDCVWTFAAADTGVDAYTAAIGVDAPTFECHVDPKTTARNLIQTLSAADSAIRAPLPGLGVSLYDTLGECFENPINRTPLTVAGSATPTYVDADVYYTSASYVQKWWDTRAALVAGFDRVCGDTFCSGDFGNLQAMDLVCAVTKSTGNVRGCSWVFGGSYTMIARTGTMDVTSRSFSCPIAMHGTLSQLITTITAPTQPGAEEPINRPLPGVTTSAYESLLGCLP